MPPGEVPLTSKHSHLNPALRDRQAQGNGFAFTVSNRGETQQSLQTKTNISRPVPGFSTPSKIKADTY